MSLILPIRLRLAGAHEPGLFLESTVKATAKATGASWGSASSGGDFTIVVFTWEDGSNKIPTSVTFGGVGMTLDVTTPSALNGVAIATYPGPLSGNFVVNFTGSGDIADCAFSVLSIYHDGTVSVVDTDIGTTSLGALTSPGTGGYRIVGACDANPAGQTFTGVTAELEDTTGGNGDYQHAVAYHFAASSASIGDASAERMAGISVSLT